MVSNCSQTIISNDYHDFIINYNSSLYESLVENPSVCVQNIDNQWILLHSPAEYTPSVSRDGYLLIPKLYALMDSTNMDASGITQIQSQPRLMLRGQGVLVGIIDTGIDYLNKIFTYTRGLSKIEALWDQTIQDNSSENEYGYGTIYYNKDINEALQAEIRGEDPYQIVPSKDDNGHGTFLAGIACGREDPQNNFIGAAPDAGILVVKLKPAKQYLRDFYLIQNNAIAYQETDIMTALKFMYDTAFRLGKPIAICLGIGSNNGPHTSEAPLPRYTNFLSDFITTSVVCPVGNEGNAKHHFQGTKQNILEYETVEIDVGANEKGFVLELWGRQSDLFSVSITSPTGENIPRIPARDTLDSTRIDFVFEDTIIYIDYNLVENASGREVIFMRFVKPTQGIWKINVHVLVGLSGNFDMWLPVTEFLTSDVHFLKPSPETTLTQPSTAIKALSIGAYDHRTDSIYINSGRGPTADGRIKPDLVAPGVNVFGPGLNGTYTTRTGTSVAAAHVAGAVALFFSWDLQNNQSTYLSSSTIKSLLIRGARRSIFRSYPNTEFGYGALDVYNAFEQMRIQ